MAILKSAKDFTLVKYQEMRLIVKNLPWKKVDILQSIDKDSEVYKRALKDAEKHTSGNLNIPFTEARVEWVLLYDHARSGQITPEAMRRMKRRDLYYLAGMTFPHPAFMQPKKEGVLALMDDSNLRWDAVTKLQGNVARAKNELERRKFIWTSMLAIVAAFLGAFMAAILRKIIVTS